MPNAMSGERIDELPAGADVSAQVLIVGLGPVGVVLSALLGQAGITVVAIDRDTDIYPLPRAAAFDDEIMRVFQQLQLADEIVADTRVINEYEFVNAAGQRLLHFKSEPMAASGWAPSYSFHQPTVERALRRKLASLPSVEVRFGHRFVRLERNDSDGVVAIVVGANGQELRVTARYLVGCDGGASAVRKQAAIELFDYGFEEPWLVVDVQTKHEEGLSSHPIQYCDPQRPVTMVPMNPGRHRWEFMLLPGEKHDEMLSDVVIQQLLSRFVAPGQAQIVRKAVYLFHGLVAKCWRKHSLFLAGDAAHQIPPFMGQGLCSGIRDAANLAWKLAMVLNHQGEPALLDSYQIEREPHVRTIVEKAIQMGRVVCTIDPEAAALRDARMLQAAAAGALGGKLIPDLQGGLLAAARGAGELFPQPMIRLKDGRTGRLDDLLDNKAWLISSSAVEVIVSTVSIYQLDVDFEDGGAIERWLAERNAVAVLVRPDRYVFGTGEPQWLVDQWQAGLRASSAFAGV